MADRDDVLLLVQLAMEDGGRCDPARMARRPASSTSRQAFELGIGMGFFDAEGWVRLAGHEALAASTPRASSEPTQRQKQEGSDAV